MNQMSPRPGHAARRSEDIGDVLSAIRRLIAEDDALDYARDTLEKQQSAQVGDPVGVAPHPVRRPQENHAAMARRMVAQSAAAMATRLSASRALPARRDPALPAAPPLRLRESDRVIAGLPEADTPASCIDPASQIAACPADEDDFAEAFAAKALMRPLAPSPVIASPAPSESGQLEAAVRTDKTGDTFWQAYANAPDRFAATKMPAAEGWHDRRIGAAFDDHDLAIEAGTFPDALATSAPQITGGDGNAAQPIADIDAATPDALPEDTAPVCATLSIPSYPADEAGDGDGEALTDASEAKTPAAAIGPAAPLTALASEPDQTLADAAQEQPESSIRTLIREMVQEELHGELGQRFSRNLRAVIRREVASAIDDHLERL